MFDKAMDFLQQNRDSSGEMKVLLVQDNSLGLGGGDGDGGVFDADPTLEVYTDLLDQYSKTTPLSCEITSPIDQSTNGPTNDKMGNYDVVIWFTGTGTPFGDDKFLTSQDQNELTKYLNSGGHLLLTGQNMIDSISESPFVLDTLHLVLIDKGIFGNGKVLGAPYTIYDNSNFDLFEINQGTDIVVSDNPKITKVNLEYPMGYYRYKTGTHMASAFATGTAALVYSQFPTMDAETVKQRLMNSGKSLSSLSDKTVSGKMVNAFRAIWDQDIPGTPLLDSIVSDKLDAKTKRNVVYSIDVKAGDQINLSLSGDAGTDFDLDLFDSSATTS